MPMTSSEAASGSFMVMTGTPFSSVRSVSSAAPTSRVSSSARTSPARACRKLLRAGELGVSLAMLQIAIEARLRSRTMFSASIRRAAFRVSGLDQSISQ